MIEQMTGGALIREQCFVGGRWVAARSGETLRVHDPADRRVVAAVPSMSSEDVRAAVDAAVEAFDAWRDTLPGVRATLLRRWLDLIKAHRSELAAILTAESGKPLNEALGEIDYAASYVEWFAEEARRAYGDVVPSHQPDKRVLVIRQPVGPVAAITSWNFPSALVTRKAAPALAAGCTVIIKPASQTPLSSLALAELGQRAGFPPGVLNVVTGPSATVGPALLADPRIRKLTFTGSTDTGKALMRACADTLKRVSLELGGNAPFIVFDDADLERAVDGAMQSKFRNAGQTCVCTNRLLVHESLYEPFVAQLADRVARLKVGAGADPGTEIGPLIDESAVCKMESHVADAISRGARVVVGGCRLAPSGNFFAPGRRDLRHESRAGRDLRPPRTRISLSIGD